MSGLLLFEQALNGLQFGLMLFLLAAGLTIVFGVMDMINLAHGSLYMIGAYVGATVIARTGSFTLGIVAALSAAALAGMLVAIPVSRVIPAEVAAQKENSRLGIDQETPFARTPASAQPVDDRIVFGDLGDLAEQAGDVRCVLGSSHQAGA